MAMRLHGFQILVSDNHFDRWRLVAFDDWNRLHLVRDNLTFDAATQLRRKLRTIHDES